MKPTCTHPSLASGGRVGDAEVGSRVGAIEGAYSVVGCMVPPIFDGWYEGAMGTGASEDLEG